jgi:hydroxyethylthiazole kinase-like uncharacterized protein yjeF
MESLALFRFATYLQPRPREFHKGDAGHLLIVGGNQGFAGAVILAGEAALRTGAGLVSIATRVEHAGFLSVSRPELMCHGVAAESDLSPLLEKADVIVVGPGLGQTAWSKMLLTAVLTSEKPVLVDADGLNLLAENPLKKSNWILTPHPGEAARLLKQTVESVQHNRVASVQKIQNVFGGVSILKGMGSLIVGESSEPVICTAGNPGMATAGMGDVLSGVIGGLLAQGLPLEIGAQLGVLMHALAGDAAAEHGERGMIASDLMGYLREVVNK